MGYSDPKDAERINQFQEVKEGIPLLLENFFRQTTPEQREKIEEQIVPMIADAAKAYYNQDYETAKVKCQEVLTLFPGEATCWQFLGLIAHKKGKTDLSIELFQHAISLDPTAKEYYCYLGDAYVQKKLYYKGIEAYKKGLEIDPEENTILCNLGVAYLRQGLLKDAQDILEKAISRVPDSSHLYINLFNTLHSRGLLDQIEDLANRTDELMKVENFQGTPQEQLESYARCLGAFLFGSIPVPSLTSQEILRRHRSWQAKCCNLNEEERYHYQEPYQHKRLRIGYISADFHDHPVGRFIFNHLRFHDRNRFDIYCYNDIPIIDTISSEMQAFPINWRTLAGLMDGQIAKMIHDDEIDILVDLSGHSNGGKMRMLNYNPAPIILHYLGYPASLGHPDITYRFADPLVDFPEDQQDFSEELIYLKNGLWSYYVPERDRQSIVPYIPKQHITFGCFNALHKITDEVIDTWSKILHQVPNSSLVLKNRSMNCAATRQMWRGRFAQRGIEPLRIQLHPGMSRAEHMAFTSQVDIALDPWPYNGTTTTCDLFISSVPVIALRGKRHAARVSAALLHRIGLDELVGNSTEEYIDIAIKLANDPVRLSHLHQTIAPTFCNSIMVNNPTITRDIEEQYTQLWERYCKQFQRLSRSPSLQP
jgi:predicted O-linked N-acetylglucosamine transferase (SPINDLY family)